MGFVRSKGYLYRFYSTWQGKKDSNLRMLESKSSALTNLAIPLHRLAANCYPPLTFVTIPTGGDALNCRTL